MEANFWEQKTLKKLNIWEPNIEHVILGTYIEHVKAVLNHSAAEVEQIQAGIAHSKNYANTWSPKLEMLQLLVNAYECSRWMFFG